LGQIGEIFAVGFDGGVAFLVDEVDYLVEEVLIRA
jgi:hypothetical protein